MRCRLTTSTLVCVNNPATGRLAFDTKTRCVRCWLCSLCNAIVCLRTCHNILDGAKPNSLLNVQLYSMGFYASVEAAALAWDITAASLQRCRKLNFPEVSFIDLEQQLDALKCVISQAVPASHSMPLPAPMQQPIQPEMMPGPDGEMLDPGEGAAHMAEGMHAPHDMHQQEDMHHQPDDMHAPHVPGPSDGENHAAGVPLPGPGPEGSYKMAATDFVPAPGDVGPPGPDQIIPGQPLHPVGVPVAGDDAAMMPGGEAPGAAELPAAMCVPGGEVPPEVAMDSVGAAVVHHAPVAEEEVPELGEQDVAPPPGLAHATSDVTHATQHETCGVPETAVVDEFHASSARASDMNSTVPEAALPSMEHLQQSPMMKGELATTACISATEGVEGACVENGAAAISAAQAEGNFLAPEFAATSELHTEFPAAENVVPVTPSAEAAAALTSVRAVVSGEFPKGEAVVWERGVADTKAADEAQLQPVHSEPTAEMQN